MESTPLSPPRNVRPAIPDRRRRAAAAAVLIAITFAVYSRTADHPFITFDDEVYVSNNEWVRQGLTGRGISWAFSTMLMGNYHPLTWLSHMTDATLFGMDAGRHHLGNVFFHMLNTLVLFHLLFRLTGRLPRSAFAAALFAVHPLHVESVAWISERKDVLSTLLFLLTILAYKRFLEKRTACRYSAVFLLMAAGLLSKSMLVSLPIVLLLLDFWPLGRFPGMEEGRPVPSPGIIVLEKVPLAVLSIAAGSAAMAAQTAAGATDVFHLYPFGFRAGNALISCCTYLAKTLWPSSLAVYYPYPQEGLASWKIFVCGATVLLITVLAVLAARRRPFLTAGWFWYLVTLVPVVGLVQVGEQAMADRYSYIPLTGIFVALAWGASEWASNRGERSPRVLGAAGAAAIAALAAAAWIQVGYWSSSGTLYEHALKVTSGNWMMHNNLGVIRCREGRVAEALGHYAESVRIEPNFPLSNFNLGETLLLRGNVDPSVMYLRKAVALNPRNSVMRLVLGRALSRQGRFDEALGQFREASRLDPSDGEIRWELRIAEARGRPDPGTNTPARSRTR